MIAFVQNPRWLPLNRIGWDRVADTTIHGQPAFVVSTADDPDFLGVNWVEDIVTYMVGSRGLDEATLISLVDQLQPATPAEWNSMAATSPTAPPETGTTDPPPTTTP